MTAPCRLAPTMTSSAPQASASWTISGPAAPARTTASAESPCDAKLAAADSTNVRASASNMSIVRNVPSGQGGTSPRGALGTSTPCGASARACSTTVITRIRASAGQGRAMTRCRAVSAPLDRSMASRMFIARPARYIGGLRTCVQQLAAYSGDRERMSMSGAAAIWSARRTSQRCAVCAPDG